MRVKELQDTMRVAIEVGVELCGGSVLVTVASETQGKRLTTMVTELIQSREGRFGVIGEADRTALDEVRHELTLAAELLAQRVELERDRARARGEA